MKIKKRKGSMLTVVILGMLIFIVSSSLLFISLSTKQTLIKKSNNLSQNYTRTSVLNLTVYSLLKDIDGLVIEQPEDLFNQDASVYRTLVSSLNNAVFNENLEYRNQNLTTIINESVFSNLKIKEVLLKSSDSYTVKLKNSNPITADYGNTSNRLYYETGDRIYLSPIELEGSLIKKSIKKTVKYTIRDLYCEIRITDGTIYLDTCIDNLKIEKR